jgi:hypothetical protein
LEKHTKRKGCGKALNNIIRRYQHRAQEWETEKTVCTAKGLPGNGKTSFVLEHFKEKRYFYFSFAGLSEEVAEKLFAEKVSERTGTTVSGWKETIKAVSKEYKYILLDDLASISSYKRLRKAFYDHMITDLNTRPFVVLITQSSDDISGLADRLVSFNIDYFCITEIAKLFPKTQDILGLCTISGGIPKILREYEKSKTFEDNLRIMLNPSSAFCEVMQELLSRCFRRPENYHYILCAIANGSHSVSEIGKFTRFPYNKCDNYLAGLIDCGFIKTEKVVSKRGAEKTAYKLTNNYFKLWHLYVYNNRTEIQLENEAVINGIIQDFVVKEIHAFHLQKAFEYANEKFHDMWTSFGIKENVIYNPQVVSKGKFRYTFDAIARNNNKAVFIKVLENPQDNCGRDEFETIRKAVELANTYYESCVFIFAKGNFSEYAVKEAASDDAVRLVRVEQLK